MASPLSGLAVIMSSFCDKVYNASFFYFDEMLRGICLSIYSSFSKSFWNSCMCKCIGVQIDR